MANPIPDDPLRFEEAIRAIRKRVPIGEREWDTLTKDEREFAFKVAGAAQADLATQVWEGVERAVREGTTLETFKASFPVELEASWGGPDPGRVETIFRTNVMGSYNEGRHAVMTAPAVKRDRPFWRFDAIPDDRISDICEELDGTVLPQDDPFWARHTPPLHPNCRSVLVPITAEEAGEEGVDDDGPDVEMPDGFGASPSSEGRDWDPSPGDYPDPIGDILRDRLR